MAVTLPTSTPTLAPEYAATTIQFTRGMVPNADGHLVASFGCQIAYTRTDYLVDEAGNKLTTVARQGVNPVGAPDPYVGYIYLAQADLLALAPSTPTSDLLETLADAADALIHADLLKREILAAPVEAAS